MAYLHDQDVGSIVATAEAGTLDRAEPPRADVDVEALAPPQPVTRTSFGRLTRKLDHPEHAGRAVGVRSRCEIVCLRRPAADGVEFPAERLKPGCLFAKLLLDRLAPLAFLIEVCLERSNQVDVRRQGPGRAACRWRTARSAPAHAGRRLSRRATHAPRVLHRPDQPTFSPP